MEKQYDLEPALCVSFLKVFTLMFCVGGPFLGCVI